MLHTFKTKSFWQNFLFKLFLTALLLGFTFRLVDFDTLAENLKKPSPATIALMTFLLFLHAWIASLRWRYVSARLFPAPSSLTYLRAVLLERFANNLLPSIIGGDTCRAYVIQQAAPISMKRSLLSVLIDRLLALSGIFLAFLLPLPFLALTLSKTLPWFTPLALACLFIMAVTGALLFLLKAHLKKYILAAKNWFLRNNLHPQDFFCLKLAGLAFGSSFFNQLLINLCYWILLKDMGIDLSFETALFMLPLITLLALLPISIGGWGIREASAVILLSTLGISHDASLAASISFGFISLFAGLVFGGLWGMGSLLHGSSKTK